MLAMPLSLSCRWLSFVLVLALTACRPSVQPVRSADAELGAELRPSEREILQHADSMVLLRIDPGDALSPDPGRGFHGYEVTSSAEVTSAAARAAISAALERGVDAASFEDVHLCFSPHHAIAVERAGVRVDFVICFNAVRCTSTRAPVAVWRRSRGRRSTPSTRSSRALGRVGDCMQSACSRRFEAVCLFASRRQLARSPAAH